MSRRNTSGRNIFGKTETLEERAIREREELEQFAALGIDPKGPHATPIFDAELQKQGEAQKLGDRFHQFQQMLHNENVANLTAQAQAMNAAAGYIRYTVDNNGNVFEHPKPKGGKSKRTKKSKTTKQSYKKSKKSRKYRR